MCPKCFDLGACVCPPHLNSLEAIIGSILVVVVNRFAKGVVERYHAPDGALCARTRRRFEENDTQKGKKNPLILSLNTSYFTDSYFCLDQAITS